MFSKALLENECKTLQHNVGILKAHKDTALQKKLIQEEKKWGKKQQKQSAAEELNI